MFTVRKFKPTDMFSIIKISYDTLTERYNPSLFNYFHEIFPEGFWVCEKNHRIVGFIVGVKTNLEIARILILAVLRLYRRQGVGNILLNNFLREITIKNTKQVELEVETKNNSAIEFYLKHGFEIIEVLPKFYQNGNDAYVMRLII
jgi:ribosomal-protein-alanine N-acetyltransferase